MKRDLLRVAYPAGCLALATVGAHADGLLPDYITPIEVAAAAIVTAIAGGAILAALLIRRRAA